MIIVNGRVDNEVAVGKLTCKDASVVDYCIASPHLFPMFCEFDIIDFNDTCSDVHCPVHIILKAIHSENVQIKSTEGKQLVTTVRPRWSADIMFRIIMT